MSRRCTWFIPVAVLTIGFSSALADSPPSPGARERAAAETIRKAGYACPRVVKLVGAPTNTPHYDEMTWGSGAPNIATCKNKRRFLVAHRGKTVTAEDKQPNPMARPL